MLKHCFESSEASGTGEQRQAKAFLSFWRGSSSTRAAVPTVPVSACHGILFPFTFFDDHFCFITSPVYKHPWCYFPSHDPREGFFWAKTDSFLSVCCGGAPDFGLLTLARSSFCSLGCPVKCTCRKCCRRKARMIFPHQTKDSKGSSGSPHPFCTHSTASRKQDSQVTTKSHCQRGPRRPQLLLQAVCLQAWDTPPKGW